MVAEGDKISESVAIKLFDQVKYASDQTTNAVKDLTRVVGDLTKCIEKQPDLNDMSKICVNRGYDCQHIKNNTDIIKNVVTKLTNKVSIMILTVVIVFGLIMTSYLFVRNSVENMINERVTEVHKTTELEGGN
jgi:hypothetical protein